MLSRYPHGLIIAGEGQGQPARPAQRCRDSIASLERRRGICNFHYPQEVEEKPLQKLYTPRPGNAREPESLEPSFPPFDQLATPRAELREAHQFRDQPELEPFAASTLESFFQRAYSSGEISLPRFVGLLLEAQGVLDQLESCKHLPVRVLDRLEPLR